ncbi:MAG: MFS transporter, partial [Caulobacterales bacterium]|nr:MFS transporter [Caulobacterales bacterium]
ANRRIAPHAQATAQAIHGGLVYGAALAAASVISGVLFEAFGAAGYWAMAATSLAGAALAPALMRRRPAEPARG